MSVNKQLHYDNPPQISEELVEYLNTYFPDRCPKMTDTERDIFAAVGARKVVDHLKALHDAQQESPQLKVQ
jgi:hypothetical protein